MQQKGQTRNARNKNYQHWSVANGFIGLSL